MQFFPIFQEYYCFIHKGKNREMLQPNYEFPQALNVCLLRFLKGALRAYLLCAE